MIHTQRNCSHLSLWDSLCINRFVRVFVWRVLVQIGLKGPRGEYRRRAPSTKIDEDLLESGNLVYSPILSGERNESSAFRFLSTGDLYDFSELHESSSFDSVLNFRMRPNTTGLVSVIVGSDTLKDFKSFKVPVSP